MILRNPASMRDSFFGFILSAVLFCLSHLTLHAQGLSGIILEESSRHPVPYAAVRISSGDVLIYSTITDANGRYSYTSVKAGRVEVSITATGYSDHLITDIILDGYTTQRLDHFLEKNVFDLPDVTVVANRRDPGSFVRTITPDDMVLVAGNFEDPVRIAHSQPGIVLLNDQANHISLRGKSPIFNTWYLEGLEIVNPSHTNNAGTLSDLPTQYGGGINMFSAQMLGSTNIYTGIDPLRIRCNGGATIDMHLHESVKPEWRAKAGLLGFEMGGGAATGKNSMLDFNLRYSFTGLLSNLGVDFGGEKIGFYDGVISYRKTGPQHMFKLFVWAGSSENRFDSVEVATDRERYKDFFNIDYINHLIGTGVRYDLSLNKNTTFRSGASLSSNQVDYIREGRFQSSQKTAFVFDQISILSSYAEFHLRHSQRMQTVLGIGYTNRFYLNGEYEDYPFDEESLLKPTVQITLAVTPSFKLVAGGDMSYSFMYDAWIPGYLATASFALNKRHSIHAGIRYGRGQVQVPSESGEYYQSQNIELGYTYENGIQHLSLSVYYQKMYRLLAHVLFESGGQFDFAHIADYPYISDGLWYGSINTGISRHIGIEGTWGMISKKGWRVDVNQSFYKSERGVALGSPNEAGRYSGRYATHFSISKEMISEKKEKNRIWNFSLRGLLHGGLLEPRISENLSEIEENTEYVFPAHFNQRLPVFKRIDAGIARTIAYEKVRWRYALDIQNLLGLTNVAYRYYDPFLNEIKDQEHLGIIPVLSVQVSW